MSDKLKIEDIIDLNPIEDETLKTASELIKSRDPIEQQQLLSLFNEHWAKKDLAQVLKLDQLWSKVIDQVNERFSKRPDNFNNMELLNYLTTIQNARDKVKKDLDIHEKEPSIQLNQVNVNIKEDSLDRKSKKRVTEAVKAILQRLKQDEEAENNDVIIIEEESEEKLLKEDNEE